MTSVRTRSKTGKNQGTDKRAAAKRKGQAPSSAPSRKAPSRKGSATRSKGLNSTQTPSSEATKPEARPESKPAPRQRTARDLYRMSLGLDADGQAGPVNGQMHPENALALVIGTSPIEAMHNVHEDGMAIVRCMADPGLDMDSDDRIHAANALWRILDRLAVATEFLRRGLDAHEALYR